MKDPASPDRWHGGAADLRRGDQEQSRAGALHPRAVPDARDAEDILQDVFYELVEANRLLMPIEHVTGWLFASPAIASRISSGEEARRLRGRGDRGRRTANGCRSKICCRRPMPGPKRSTCATCFSRNSSWR